MSPSERSTPARSLGGKLQRSIRAWLAFTAALTVVLALVDLQRASPPLPRVVELELLMPEFTGRRREPIVTTGVPGRGDFLFVSYLSADTLSFGYDSWGSGGPESPPYKFKPGRPLRLRIMLPALAALATGQREQQLEVAVDGQPSWAAKVSMHACQPENVQWAINQNGGTSCAGELDSVLRRPGGHEVRGTGTQRYHTTKERVEWWISQTRFRLAWFVGLAAILALPLAVAVPWGRWRRGLRELFSPQAYAGNVPSSHPTDHADQAASWLHRLPTRPFLLGVVLGFAVCVAGGLAASRQAPFRSFVRFFQPIQPQTHFYPTARQLVAYIERTVPRDKILVLVGGASYFRGTGQNPGELWTHELQRRLGPTYAVVNFAIDQADPSSFAAVVAQIVQIKYPRMIYVCSGGAMSESTLDGGDVYRYLYWDAYYKGLLPVDPEWDKLVRWEARRQFRTPAGEELHLGQRLDALTYAADLWTWVGYNLCFTVWSDSYPVHPFRARGRYVEQDDPNIAHAQQQARKDTALNKLMEERALDFSRAGYVATPEGKWIVGPDTISSVTRRYEQMLPPSLRSRCLVVLLHGNPYFMRNLSAEDRGRLSEISALTRGVLEKIGCQAVQAGQDFSPDDFVDAGHFTASGGNKIAAIVAEKILDLDLR
ncbi:MAG: hypothetical protein EXS41_08345 [Opitutaceae bacterium]|nr:hypothetical protein [Opitutaceae bacterium]